MTLLGTAIVEAVLDEYGWSEVLTRLAQFIGVCRSSKLAVKLANLLAF
jgi:hypothetical protein